MVVTVVGTIDGLPAEMDYDPTDDEVPVEGRIELNRHTWRELDPHDESDRKLIDRFEESN